MATPLTAGAAALVREHLQKQLPATPSAEIVKASLINGAQKLDPADDRPNAESGWGRIDLESSLVPAAPRRIIYADRVEIAAHKTLLIPFVVSSSDTELRATLVWADPPNESLVHDLDLTLVDPEANDYYMANERIPDGKSNVEGVDIESPAVGDWELRVTSSSLTTERQPFAIVLSGAVTQDAGE